MSKGSKNANGQGTIFYRARDDRWVVQVNDPLTGKRVTRTARTENKAKALLRELLNRVDAGKPAVEVTNTLQQYAQTWFKEQAGKRRAATTVHEYQGRLRRHVFDV